jgi:ribosomal protein L11 methyltransferase
MRKQPWDEVDWEEQWALFAKNFKEGKAHIKVGEKTLLLLPGPGFGDLSHPTTALMMKMMKKHVPHESVIDIGTGSGILALASLLLKAKSAIGIDIDEEALKHARKNRKLNHLKALFTKKLPQKLPQKNILLMNMILPEQRQFAPQRLNPLAKLWIVSGILFTQKGAYLAQAKEWGWSLVSQHKQGEWVGFVFKLG